MAAQVAIATTPAQGVFPASPTPIRFTGGAHSATLTGALTMGTAYPPILKLDANGASRNVTLEPEEESEGLSHWIVNAATGAFNLVILDDAAATIVTINQNEGALVYCDGTAWTLIHVQTIALS